MPDEESTISQIVILCRNWLNRLLFSWVGVLLMVPVSLATPYENLSLTKAETAWLQAHPVVRVGVDPDFAPYEFLDDNGHHLGLSSEYLSLLSERLGIEFRVIRYPGWSDVMNAIRAGKLDILAAATETPERRKFLSFTRPYINYKIAIVTQWDRFQISKLSDLSSKPVALVKDYAFSELVLRKQSDIRAVYVDSVLKGLESVADGKAEAIVADLGSISYKIRQYKLNSLEVAGLVDLESEGLAMGVRDDWPIFRSILDKTLASITNPEHEQILRKWVPVSDKVNIGLSDSERAFIDQHPMIRLGVDPEFAPFEFINEKGRYSGMAADYIQLLNRRLGIDMEVVKGRSWAEAVNGVKEKRIDVLPAVGITEERKHFLNYSKPYIQFYRVIITRTDMPFLSGLDDIASMRVGVQKNSSHEGFLKDHTKIEAIPFDTLQESLQAVADGRIDAIVGNVASAAYWIRKMNLINLKVSAAASTDVQTLHFAVRNDWPELVTILNKGLNSISLREHQLISEKWVLLKHDPKLDSRFWKLLIISSVVLLLLLFWLFTMHRQRQKLKQARDQAYQANTALTAMRDELEELVKQRTGELMQTEKKLQHAQKMEALGTLVGGIAHDFNNKLMAISGNLYLAEHSKADDGKRGKSLDNANKLVFEASEMIQQLLLFARKGSLELTPVSMTSFVKEAMRLNRVAIPENIKLSVDYPADALTVMGDATQLQQLFLNLLANSRDALEGNPDPRIDVRLEFYQADADFQAAHPDLSDAKSFALLKVIDNGSGIDPKHLPHIFDPFFTTKQVGKGTGLGMAMVYGVVQAHQGAIQVESELGSGTTFSIYFPLSDLEHDESEQASVDTVSGNGEMILIADDEQSVRDSFRDVLRSLNYQVMVASNGQKALNLFKAHQDTIDLVILDIVMPEMKGPTAAVEIRRIQPDMKVLFASGYDSRDEELKTAPDIRVLDKPFRFDEASRIIRDLLDE